MILPEPGTGLGLLLLLTMIKRFIQSLNRFNETANSGSSFPQFLFKTSYSTQTER
ncbi:hypothetical protein V6Z12_D03G040000 [Gossypium hirsutum]